MINSRPPATAFTEKEKRQIIEEYLKGGRTKVDIWRQYTGHNEEHGQLLRWMRQLGYVENTFLNKPVYLSSMPASNKPQPSVEELQQKIKLLEKQLLDSQLKEEAYRKMIEIAEQDLKISIRKKSNTK